MKKNQQTAPLPSADSLEEAIAHGIAVCPSCQHHIALETVKPLEETTCPKCGKSFLVPRKIGNFYLYKAIASGGMGSVFHAVSKDFPNRDLAVKLLSRVARDNPTNVMALLNEARISARFKDSRYLAGCLAHGYDDDEYYTVMDFVNGERLDELIARLGRIPETMLISIVRHILAGEQHIFRLGYLFRDLKPENIIVTKDGYAVMLDFGLCIPVEEALNAGAEYVSGSPYYVPPERLLGHPEDARSEIYSLGMIMYFALTGNTYFNANEINALVKRHLSDLRVSASAKMAGISKDLGDLIARMIDQDPEKRPASFIDVFNELNACSKEPFISKRLADALAAENA